MLIRFVRKYWFPGIVFFDYLLKAVFLGFFPEKVVMNEGFALHLGAGWGNLFSLALSALFLALVLLTFRKSLSTVGIKLVMAGGIGNITDRLLYGGVVDYIWLAGISRFNLSDISVVAGILLLSFPVLRREKHSTNP